MQKNSFVATTITVSLAFASIAALSWAQGSAGSTQTPGARPVDADSVPPEAGSVQLDAQFSYAAAFTCGVSPQTAFVRIVPGRYATAVQIHNPSLSGVSMRRRLSLTFPSVAAGPAPLPGLVSDWIMTEIGPGESIEVDCGEIPGDFLRGVMLPPYVQGFLVIQSRTSLDVTAIHTTATIDGKGNMNVQSIDVQEVDERIL